MGDAVEGLVSETTCYNADPNEGNYTCLNNTCIRDPRLSLKAKGLHTYLMSLPPGWHLYKSELVTHFRDGMDSVNSAIKELEEYGYVEITEQKRTESGKFSSKSYGFHAIPKDQTDQTDQSSRNGFPVTAKPLTVKPSTENPVLLTTNKLNINKLITKLTNCMGEQTVQKDSEPQDREEVSESVFSNKIKELFGGEYPFDKNFENAVLSKLSEYKVSEDAAEDFLDYVYERTKLGNPKKSFEGFYRKLALASSIMRDFVYSGSCKKEHKESGTNQSSISYVECPICGTSFDRYVFYCPECNASVDAIEKNDERDLRITKGLYEMSPEQREKYNEERRKREMASPMHFLVGEELDQLYKDFGLID